MVQDGSCFSLVQRVDGGLPWEFAPSVSDREWYWPIGGSIGAGGLLYVFWSRMVEDGAQAFLDGITRHPVQTWLGVYDPNTFATISFEPAPNAGVFPQYGSAVQTAADGYSYLFGNSNMLELSREGGYGKPSPFSGTRMYVARVPAGQFQSAAAVLDRQRLVGQRRRGRAVLLALVDLQRDAAAADRRDVVLGGQGGRVLGRPRRRRTSQRTAGPVDDGRRPPGRGGRPRRPRRRADDHLPAGDHAEPVDRPAR